MYQGNLFWGPGPKAKRVEKISKKKSGKINKMRKFEKKWYVSPTVELIELIRKPTIQSENRILSNHFLSFKLIVMVEA